MYEVGGWNLFTIRNQELSVNNYPLCKVGFDLLHPSANVLCSVSDLKEEPTLQKELIYFGEGG